MTRTLAFTFLLYGLWEYCMSKIERNKISGEESKEIEEWKRNSPKTVKLIKKYYGDI